MTESPWSTVAEADGCRVLRAPYTFPGGRSHTVVVERPGATLVYSPGAALAPTDGASPFAVDSPGRHSGPSWEGVLLLAPSQSHTLGLAAWQARFPDAGVFAAPAARERVAEKSGLGPGGRVGLLADAPLLTGVELHEVPGTRTGEVWARVRCGARTLLLVCDAVTNIEQLAARWWMRTLQRLYGLRTGPALGPGFRRGLTDDAAFRAWAHAQLDEVELVLPCHGAPLAGAELETLRGLLRAGG